MVYREPDEDARREAERERAAEADRARLEADRARLEAERAIVEGLRLERQEAARTLLCRSLRGAAIVSGYASVALPPVVSWMTVYSKGSGWLFAFSSGMFTVFLVWLSQVAEPAGAARRGWQADKRMGRVVLMGFFAPFVALVTTPLAVLARILLGV